MLSTFSSDSFYEKHGLSLFWLFTSILLVLELLTLNFECMQNSSNALISFCATLEVFAKSTTSFAYNKSMNSAFPMITSQVSSCSTKSGTICFLINQCTKREKRQNRKKLIVHDEANSEPWLLESHHDSIFAM